MEPKEAEVPARLSKKICERKVSRTSERQSYGRRILCRGTGYQRLGVPEGNKQHAQNQQQICNNA
jgi:hypothetical protein